MGTATIAREAVLRALFRAAEQAEVLGIASRDLAKARAVAAEFGIPRAYGSYDELLADGDIEAVYIPLPNHLHVPYSIRALEAGKHVLCEKPLARSAAEAEELASVARRHPHLKVMEAFMYRFHPQWVWTKRTVDEERIGRVRTIQSSFSFFDDNPASILHHAEWGGGALLDIGCYSISLSRFLFGAEPLRVVASIEIDSTFRVDRLTSGILEFAAGTATFTCATCAREQQFVLIQGERGSVRLETPFNPRFDRACRAWLEGDGGADARVEVSFDACDQYGIQADLFAQAIRTDGAVPTPLEDAVANLRTIDALVRSAESGTWQTL